MTGHRELQCAVHPFGTLTPLRFVVVCSFYENKYVLSYHSGHQSWETQGGHIEKNETPEQAARRELYEESGVRDANIFRTNLPIFHTNLPVQPLYATASA